MAITLAYYRGPVQPLNQPQPPREHTAVAVVRRIELNIHIIKLFQPCTRCYGLGEPQYRHNISKVDHGRDRTCELP